MEDRHAVINENDWGVLALRKAANSIAHMIVGLVVFFIVRFAAASFLQIGDFQLHIMFSVCGYQLLMVEAILSFNRDGPLGVRISRNNTRLIHLVLATLGVISSLTGAILGLRAHGAKFDTAHGICGLVALICSLITSVGGILTFFSSQLRDKINPSVIKTLHIVCGSVAVTMGLVTLCLGINKPFLVVILFGQETATCLIIFIVLALLYTLIMPMISLKRQVNNMRATIL